MTPVRFILYALVLAGGLCARASDVIPAPKSGLSASVKQPHVTAELISETTHITPGKPFLVALHLHMDPGWHTYWVNPGDAGLATTIKWTLPAGFTAGPIQWPVPEIHMMGPLTTYGYAGDVYLLTTITPPRSIAVSNMWKDGLARFEIKARAEWLVCQEECIPGKADLVLKLDAHPTLQLEPGAFFMAHARARLPLESGLWEVRAAYQKVGLGDALVLRFNDKAIGSSSIGHVYFFPEQGNVVDSKEDGIGSPDQNTADFQLILKLQQNGEKPDHLSGILVSDQPLLGNGAKAVYIPSFQVASPTATPQAAALNSAAPAGAAPPLGERRLPADSAAQSAAGGGGQRPPLQGEARPLLLAVLSGAFLGGLILNLMPCVLPVLSLKVFSLMRHAGDDPRGAWKQGAAFTAGVVISFWVLAGLLIALRAAGNHLGWGFQMQSPGFVLGLIFLFFLLGLNLFGVFELGTSLVGLDAKTTSHVGSGLTSSFLNGALATLAATPCTAPFMGSSVGFAAEQPAWVAMLIFTVLALGMASPYLLLTIFPGALRFVPKPGAWMEAFKQFMGFLLMATVIFLLYVFSALVGQDEVPYLLAALLIAGVGAWIYGKWATPVHGAGTRVIAVVLALLAVGYAIWWGTDLARATPPEISANASAANAGGGSWQPWTKAAVEAERAKGRPVFVDFTAAWCLSCKVNERVALESDEVRAAFTKKNVALFRADWTHSDPAISDVLAQYHRDGVPLYLLFPAQATAAPEVLPEVLTPGVVLDALGKLGSH